ncbi:ABC transporter permease [Demequina salsinemoris]|uniref:ABC transporter permease n=1 Tax=Demequina salsinemoris TaxID=577470 RepID=UPI000A069D1D|nr:ABC transporter permease subunit [Demequina salsinemoris]
MSVRTDRPPVRTSPPPARPGAEARLRTPARIAPSPVTRWTILMLGAVFLGLPLVALFHFTIKGGLEGGITFRHWAELLSGEVDAGGPLWDGISSSLVLAAVTVALMLALLLPTMILVRLRLPRWEKALEFVCLLPLTIPAVAMVVGLAPVYSVVARIFGSGSWTLAFAYVILCLPYAYRALQSNLSAIDVPTLSEAARTLGASWPTVLLRVLLPNLRRGVLAASFISVAVVLGEFTVASLLSRTNLQTAIVLVQKQDPYVAYIVVLLSLALALGLLLVIGRVGAATARSNR